MTRVVIRCLGLLFIFIVLAACTTTVEKSTSIPSADNAQFYWWNGSVFYEIFVRSFYDGNGDGKGDFKGLTAKLDYLNDGDPQTTTDLGVTGIWLMPIHPSPSYHGYDVTDYMNINPDYGTLDDFKEFLKAAHARGIHVIIDFVANHTSSQNPWFIASQDPNSDKRNWYIWSDTDPGYTGPMDEQVWYPGQHGFYYAIFDKGTPDLNYKTTAVTQQMDAVAQFWLKDIGVDGFRIDGAKYLIEEQSTKQENTQETHDWYKKFRTFYKGINPQALTIGEVWDSVYAALPYAKGDELDLVFDFDMANAIVTGVNGQNVQKIKNAMSIDLGLYRPGQFGIFLTNHDMNRVMSQFQGDMGKMKSAALIYLTAPGVPFLYYGEEIGMSGSKPDEKIRTPMQWSAEQNSGFTTGTPWEALQSDYDKVNVAVQTGDPASLLSWYRDLIHIRSSHPALQKGDYFKVDSGNGTVFASIRSYKGEVILVLANLDKNPVTDYHLKLDGGLLAGKKFNVTPLLGEGTFQDLSSNQQGGFSDYQPLPELPAGANLILLLKPAS